MSIKYQIINTLKSLYYTKGEPYSFAGNSLSFKIGSRPIKRKYINANDDVTKNDVLQIEYFEKHLKPNDVIWDIGAHYGHYSIFAASVVQGKNQVFAFDPDEDAIKILNANIELNNFQNKITVFNCGISDSDDVVKFKAMQGNSLSHIIRNEEENEENLITIKTRSVSSLLSEIPEPTIVKLDTEGAEIEILRNAKQLLANPKIKFVCELHPFAWERMGVHYDEFEALLAEFNRDVSLLDSSKSVRDLPFYATVLF